MDEFSTVSGLSSDFNIFGWPYTGFVTLLTLLLYQIFGVRVARARRKYKVPLPQMDGPAEFQRRFRVHQNTLEQLIVFLPLLWIAALASRDDLAAAIGIFWPLSRLIYAAGYVKDAKKRLPGFVMGILVLLALFGLSAWQLARSMLVWQ